MYPHAAILTVLSEGKVLVIPVDKAQGARLAPVELRSSRTWYDTAGTNFFVFGREDYMLNPKVAAKTWGSKPNHMDIISFDRLWRWDAPIQFPQDQR